MMRLLSIFAVLAVSSGQTARDTEVLNQADATVTKYCEAVAGLPEIDREAGREDLMGGAGEDNFIVQLVTEAGIARQNGDTPEQLADRFAEIADPGFVVGKAFAVVLAIILFVLWTLCCWFVCCPCCCRMCCRCCQRTWKTSKVFKAILWLLFIVFGVAAVIMVATAMSGASSIDNGISGTACQAATLVKDAVAGAPEYNFTGLLPAFNTLQDLANILNDNPRSQFLTDLQAIIDRTENIEKAVNLALGTINALEKIMSETKNIDPVAADSSTLYHQCQVCGPLGTVLGEISGILGSSTGEAMAQMRAKIEENLQGQAAQDLRDSITAAMAPIEAAKDAFVEQVGFFVEDGSGSFQASTEMVAGEKSMLQPAVLGFFMFYLVIALCAIMALGLWSVKDQKGEKPDHCCVRCCSGCVSCGACIYAMIVLLIAGIMVIVAMFGSGMCLVMIDFNQETGASLMSAVGAEVTPQLETALLIADRCLSLQNPENAAFSRNLADIVQIPPMNATAAANGETSTVRQEIYNLALDPIQQQIANLEASVGGDGTAPSIANDAKTQELLDMIGALEMSALYLPVESKIAASTTYSPMLDDVAGSTSPFKAYLINSVSCADVTLSAALGDLGGKTVPGITAMGVDGFTVEGTPVPPLNDYMTVNLVGTCPALSGGTCTIGPTQPGCDASKSFLTNVKQALATQTVFRCTYLINSPSDPTICYPRNMVKNPTTGVWSGTCLSSGRTYTLTRDCDIDEFNQNVKGFEADIRKAFEYFDDITASLLDDIITDMKVLVQTSVIDPVVELLSLLQCGFMRRFWQGLTDNMCYRGMNGFRLIANSYVISGLLSLCIALLIIIPWKISRDNADRAGADGEVQAATV